MRLIILDNALHDVGSHSFNNTAALSRTARARGAGVEAFGCATMPSNVRGALGAVPHFRAAMYDAVSGDPFLQDIENWLSLNETYLDDLRRLPPDVFGPDALILVPAVMQNQIDGVCRFIADDVSGSTYALQLMFEETWTPWGRIVVGGEIFYKAAIERIRDRVGRSVHLFSETEETARRHAANLGLPVGVLPAPVEAPAGGPVVRSGEAGRLRFGYLGYSKMEKGFHLLPGAVARPDIASTADFIVHVNHHHWEDAVISAEAELRVHPHVKTVTGQLDRRQYYRLFDYCDVILVPYDPARYGERGSGVVAEAISLGKPIVTSAGTWGAVAARRGDCAGVVMASWDPDGLADAIAACIAQRDALVEQADGLRTQWIEERSAARFIAKLFDLAPARIASEPAPTALPVEAPALQPETLVRFDSVAASRSFTTATTHADRPVLVGLDGCTIRFKPVHDDHSLMRVTFGVDFMIPPDAGKVDVLLNGRLFATVRGWSAGREVLTFVVPPALVPSDAGCSFTFVPSRGVQAPGEAGFFAMRIHTFTYNIDDGAESFPAMSLGSSVHPWPGSNAIGFMAGWSPAEEGWSWMVEPCGEITMAPAEDGSDVTLRLKVNRARGAAVADVDVEIDGDVLASASVGEAQVWIDVPLRNGKWVAGWPLMLKLRCKNGTRLEQDPRELFVCLSRLEALGTVST